MMVAACILNDAARLGVVLQAHGDKLRYRPRDRMTPDLADRLRANRSEVLAILRPINTEVNPALDGGWNVAKTMYTANERRLLNEAGIAAGDVPLLDAVKGAFPEALVVEVGSEPALPRRRAAAMIREYRRRGNHLQAVALRDAWRERIAICAIDGGMSTSDAGQIAIMDIDN